MNIGMNVGYSATKAVAGERRVTFPSAVGTPDRGRFSLSNTNEIILEEPAHVQVGDAAIEQSRFLHRREDRRWTESQEWYYLFLAAVSELTTATRVDLQVVTGLPVAFYGDAEELHGRLVGEHRLRRHGRHGQTITVTECRVIPEPFGTLLAVTLDDRGRIADRALATGSVGVIDVGGKTTNLLSVHRMSEIGRETDSVNAGAWDTVRALREWLNENYPNLDLRDHQIIDAIIARKTKYYGDVVDLTAVVDGILEPLADQVIAQASQLWNGAAGLDAILVSGGGALLLGPYVELHFPHARIVEDPVFANALGFWRFAERIARRG